jgi:eukaryotic-like serine/threonine-protein kinase
MLVARKSMPNSMQTQPAAPTPPQLRTLTIPRSALTQCPPGAETPLPIQLAGDYELVEPLGRGGMGVVYLARQCGLKRKVAYKMLTQVGELDPTALERFRSEAETLGRLQHSGIVQVFDSGTERGNPFLAMEYVAGGSLEDRVRLGRLDYHEAVRIVAAVAEAVGYAHSHGIIHRDLKPANILMTPEGQPKVADFGLARDLTSDHITRTGLIAGTPTYMPPEQLTGEKDLSPATDVWAIGVMFYELMAGTVPFAGADPQQILTNILRHEAVSLRDWQPHLPRDLDTICMKCLQKEPHRRYANGAELAADLQRFLEHHPILARPVGRWEKGTRWCRRNPAIAGSLLVTAVALLSATAVSLSFARRVHHEKANAIEAARNEQELRERAEKAALAEREAREVAEKAVASEKNARQDAEKAANAEKQAREGAEKAFLAEKQARTEAQAMSTMMEGIIKGLTPAPGVDLVKQFLDNLADTVKSLEASTGDPLVRARLLDLIAMTYQRIGQFDRMLRPMALVVELREKHLPLNDPLALDSKIRYGYLLLHHSSRQQEALQIMKPALEMNIASRREDRKYVIGQMGMLRIAHNAVGNEAEAFRLGGEIVELCKQEYGPDSPETLWMMVNHPKYKRSSRNYGESIPLYLRALQVFKETRKSNSIEVMWTECELGKMLVANAQYQEAIPYLQNSYNIQYEAHGLRHPFVVRDRGYLLRALEGASRYADELPMRWDCFTEAVSKGDWPNVSSHGLRCVRDCFWRYR